MKNVFKFMSLIFILVLFISCGSEKQKVDDGKIVITYAVSVGGAEPAATEALIEAYKKIEPNVVVEVFHIPEASDDARALYYQMFEAQSGDIDVLKADVVWVGEMADHLVDLNQYPQSKELSTKMFPSIVRNNTADGKLVAMPLYPDAAYLFYRTDLLEKYGFDAPPNTYEELTEMATIIQAGERAEGETDFVGFVFQGNAYEGLVCDALEWVSSYGGGTFVEPDGTVSINNPDAIEALQLAQSWVGTISPKGVTAMNENSSTQVFQSGNAAFLRVWVNNFSVINAEDSPVHGNVALSILPAGKADGRHSSALGGWQLGVNKYSENYDEAVKFLNYAAGKENQKVRAILANVAPAYMELYSDPEIPQFIRDTEDVYLNAVARPSTVTAPYYAEASRYISSGLNNMLIGNDSVENTVRKLELDLEEVMTKAREAQQ